MPREMYRASPAVAPRHRIALAALIGLFVALAVAYSHFTPVSALDPHNADETAHVLYVRAVAAGRLPVLRADRLGTDGYEAHQPPLYYVLCAPIYRVASAEAPHDVVPMLRMVSIFLGALTILAVYGAVHTLLPSEPLTALGAAGFAALLPMNVALCASVTNDALMDLLAVVVLWLLAAWAMTSASPQSARVRDRHAAWLGVALGAALLTKMLALPLFVTTALVFLLMAVRRVSPVNLVLRAATLSLGLSLLLAAGWLGRNQMLYGDPLAARAFESVFGPTHGNPSAREMMEFFGGPGRYWASVAQWSLASFWGGFDSMRLFWGQPPQQPHPDFSLPPGPIYGGLLLVAAASVGGLLRSLRAEACQPRQRALLCAYGVLVLITVLALAQFNLVYFQAQGRYLFVALLPLALFFVLGWQGLLPDDRRFRVFLGTIGAVLLSLNLYTLLGLLMPRFHAA